MPTSIVAPLLLAFGIAAAVTPVVRWIARRSGAVSLPRTDRWHREPVPLLGGVAIAIATMSGLVSIADRRAVVPLLICAGLMFALGIVDDLRRLKPVTKLVGQMVIAAALVQLAPPVAVTGRSVIDQLLAFTWIVGVTNAFNLLDNIDGLAAGVAAIAGAFFIFVVFPVDPGTLSPALAAFVGATIGFLIYNFRPASIFMGDSGSHFIGAFLAGASLLAAPGSKGQVASLVGIPLLVLLVPIFDTFFVTLTRGLSGRRAWVGGRDHTSHRLVRLGVHERDAVVTLYGLAALGGLVALSFRHLDTGYAATLAGLYVVLLAGFSVVLGHVEATDKQAVERPEERLVSELTHRYRVYEVLLDVALIALAYYAAFSLRFAEPLYAQFLPYFVRSFPVMVATQLSGLWWAGKYRQTWSTLGAPELVTILKGLVAGSAAAVILLLYLYRFEGFSRWVFVTDAAILAFLLVGSRVGIAQIDEYLRRQRTRGHRALIYGAGKGGVLLVRELLQNHDLGLIPVGFVDDDPLKRRWHVEGLRVLGTIVDLATLVERHQISTLLIAIRDLPSEQVAVVCGMCRDHGVAVRQMRFALDSLEPAEARSLGSIPHDH